MEATGSDEESTVGIVGCGQIGQSWALIFARAGFDVVLWDVDRAQVEWAIVQLRDVRVPLVDRAGLLDGNREDVSGRISRAETLREVLSRSFYVQTAVPETLEMKRQVFKQIDDQLVELGGRRNVIVASSTSSIPSSRFTEALTHRSNFLVAHPVNPPFAIPLVELVPAPWTSPEAMDTVLRLMKRIGQAPISMKKEREGFILNRLQYALLGEAVRLVQDGVCAPEDIDTAVESGLARRWTFMGPFRTIDMNAPGGVLDYNERYSPAIHDVLREQDNSVAWREDAIHAIDAAMRHINGPVDDLPAAVAWRDLRLLHLAAHLASEPDLEKR